MYKPKTSTIDSPVAIIGAGPHGLAAAAHLRHGGLEPMTRWMQRCSASRLGATEITTVVVRLTAACEALAGPPAVAAVGPATRPANSPRLTTQHALSRRPTLSATRSGQNRCGRRIFML